MSKGTFSDVAARLCNCPLLSTVDVTVLHSVINVS